MNTRTTRREFLGSAAAIGLVAHSRVLSEPMRAALEEPEPPPTLVVIYLRVGADFLNMIIPRTDPTYALMRPGIGIGEEAAGSS